MASRYEPAFRMANPDDLQAILDLHVQNFSSIGVERSLAIVEFDEPNTVTAIATQNEKLMGYVQWIAVGKSAFLTWMAVAPEAKRTGLGQALLDFAIDACREAGCAVLALDSRNRFKPAMSLYLKNGFDIIGTYLQTDEEMMIRFRLTL